MRREALPTIALVFVMVLVACTTTTRTHTTGDDPPSTGSRLPVDLLHGPGAARKALAAIEAALGASPAQVSDMTIYPEYMIVEAQDPDVPDHIDRYTWRDGDVSAPEPVHLSGPQEDVEASLYPSTSVRLADLPDIVRAAERRLEQARPIRVEQARAGYVIIERSSALDGRVTLRISIDGPRRSGNVETTAGGEILEATVS